MIEALIEQIARDMFAGIHYPAKFEKAHADEREEFLDAAFDAIRSVLTHYSQVENTTERMMKAAHHAFTHNYNSGDPEADWSCAFRAAITVALGDVTRDKLQREPRRLSKVSQLMEDEIVRRTTADKEPSL